MSKMICGWELWKTPEFIALIRKLDPTLLDKKVTRLNISISIDDPVTLEIEELAEWDDEW